MNLHFVLTGKSAFGSIIRQSHFISAHFRTATLIVLAIGIVPGWAGVTESSYERETARAKFKRPASVPQPKDNISNDARIELGKALFFDPRLSRANSISCASCHNPSFSWGDGLPKGVGDGSKELGRRTPTILNVAFADALFWDGRADTLEAQALGPIESRAEMNLPLPEMVEKLRAIDGYRTKFEAAYPGEGVTPATVGKAIAAFERTVISAAAPFDEWIAGKEDAISESAKRGFDLFNSKANCVKCHTGWNFTDNGFHDIGVASGDIGRGHILKEIEVVQHAFKTPTLRNVNHRGPYLHNGSKKTLEDVVKFYNAGGEVKRPSLADPVKALDLTTDEIRDLCNFMNTLTSPDSEVTMPVLPNP